MEESPPKQQDKDQDEVIIISPTMLKRKRRRRQRAARFEGEKTGGLVEEEGVDRVSVSNTDRIGQFWFVDEHRTKDNLLWGLSPKEKSLLRQLEPFFRD